MRKLSMNLCFAVTIAVVNILFYLNMSGNLLAFKRKEPIERSSNVHPRKAEMYQEEISKLVREAVRDHGVSRENLTSMLELAYREHQTSERTSMEDFFIHKGKSLPKNNTSDSVGLLTKVSSKEHARDGMNVEDLAPIHSVKNQSKPMDVEKLEKIDAHDPTLHDTQRSGVLGVIGNLLGSGKKETPIVFPHDHNLVINEPNKCKNDDGSDRQVFFLVLILSIHKNFDQRNAVRKTWASPKEIDGKQIVTLFLLAKNTNPRHQSLVEQESKQYKDIIMEDFMDTYKNLTLKTMMGLKWASIFCPQADYVMKTDDDMYVQFANIITYLSKPTVPTKNYVTGFVINGGPIRDPKSKWYMPKETYPGSKYPPFCSGTGYMMSGDVPGKVYETSLHTPFLYLEDVFFATCINSLHIVPVNNKGFNNWRTPYSYCKYKRIFTTHMVPPTEMQRIWNDQKTQKGYRC
ncbi:beta-1,3-galactosyltransferase 1 [Strongylocentrotus purpuratus]|uniref:Hexosyltransferase n=1 Tax=Strongylocentrotus purpuratus TaxID=7668 RepID=A0A7M7MXQ0_STRPU|nr:beta-1,3-galactosyltransferase 1 [Strongylocentrotus purpuratus]